MEGMMDSLTGEILQGVVVEGMH